MNGHQLDWSLKEFLKFHPRSEINAPTVLMKKTSIRKIHFRHFFYWKLDQTFGWMFFCLAREFYCVFCWLCSNVLTIGVYSSSLFTRFSLVFLLFTQKKTKLREWAAIPQHYEILEFSWRNHWAKIIEYFRTLIFGKVTIVR